MDSLPQGMCVPCAKTSKGARFAGWRTRTGGSWNQRRSLTRSLVRRSTRSGWVLVLKTTAVTKSLWTSSPTQKMGVEEGLGRDSPPEGERATGFSEGSTIDSPEGREALTITTPAVAAAHPPISPQFKLVFVTAAAGTLLFVVLCLVLSLVAGREPPPLFEKLIMGFFDLAKIGFGAIVGLLGGKRLQGTEES